MSATAKTFLYIILFLGSIVGGLMAAGGKEGVATTEVEGSLRCQPYELVSWLLVPKARRKWVGGLTKYEDLDMSEIEVGTRIPMELTRDGETIEVTMEILEIDPEKLVVVKETHDDWTAECRFEFEGFAGKTRLRYIRTTTYEGFFRKLFSPITKTFVKGQQVEDLDRLKKSATFEFA